MLHNGLLHFWVTKFCAKKKMPFIDIICFMNLERNIQVLSWEKHLWKYMIKNDPEINIGEK